jgi:large subunit ribosomal protein L18
MAKSHKKLNERRLRRERRIRAKIFGTQDRPRLSVFRSNRFLSAQLINDEAGVTLISGSTRGEKQPKETKTAGAARLGTTLAAKAVEKGITKVVADKGRYAYHGRLKALVEAMRKGGVSI